MMELAEISKNFGKVQALSKVSLEVNPGSIHGIIGENGAGKSTLMKILTGFISKSSGEIFFQSNYIDLLSPKDARKIGIGMLYQEPLDFPQLSVLDNFVAGAADFSLLKQSTTLSRLCKNFGFALSPESKVEELTIGERQQLDLMRLIRDGAKILILDEPTSGISERQQELLFGALRSLKDDGVAILLVSHKLEEIELLCDEVTVLRHGKIAGYQKRPFDRDEMLNTMFDTLPVSQPPAVKHIAGEPLLNFHKVTSKAGRSGLNSVSTTIRSGEVVGLAGVDGSGQSVFLRSAFGLLQPESGSISHLREVETRAFIPADRLAEGLIPGLTIREHHILSKTSGPIITSKSGLEKTRDAIKTYSIKGTSETEIENLSGGNLQRLLLSLIPADIPLILMENPTRGLDVQSAAWTWKHLHSRLKLDGAIIFASPDLEEIMEQSTRILVFYNGSITLDTQTKATDYQQLSRAVTGEDSQKQ
jgi:ABC-type uncharacterized transport system ATPase subunit